MDDTPAVRMQIDIKLLHPFRTELGLGTTLPDLKLHTKTSKRTLVLQTLSEMLTCRVERHILVKQNQIRKLALFDSIVNSFIPDDPSTSEFMLQLLADNDMAAEAEKDNDI